VHEDKLNFPEKQNPMVGCDIEKSTILNPRDLLQDMLNRRFYNGDFVIYEIINSRQTKLIEKCFATYFIFEMLPYCNLCLTGRIRLRRRKKNTKQSVKNLRSRKSSGLKRQYINPTNNN
jgi:hypothetical protein